MLLKLDNDLFLPDGMKNEMRKNYGKLISREYDLLNILSKNDILISIGDMSTYTLFKLGFQARLYIIDNKTKRKVFPYSIPKKGYCIKKVINPQGVITKKLWNIIKNSLENEQPVRIEVDGEEDLATLPAIYFAPLNAIVIYGIPDKGMAVIKVNQKMKSRINDMLIKMEGYHWN